MTQIDFYTGATDRLLIACRLCSKAVQQGLKTVVYIPDAELANRFDKLLWTFSPTSFVPHCQADDKLAGVTPVILNNQLEMPEVAYFDVLLNLDAAIPSGFEHFKRVVEIVDEIEDSKLHARKRYRRYQELGHDIRHHRLEEN
ncbi:MULTISPECIES: DNA polymerase III subunit chi [Nitrosomonas]|uniref:DNA polymerase III chi subunit n=2 Tax=Nitrosomonas eutropha TaxID=916 RepID=A0ABX5M6A1_9PROT|nr:DNA polymerase III subunit chi [Nitrosomonas eutropha]MXS79766.1 DNA polymerase III subunit chi [Nitrosomonas sp. GH22]ABI58872.1 DNA polymerase III, chi subunit [Nitrosomonas eutropha C91]PXV80546.1 DNA polymerase III chi subunit [Nitrosomonas eutropha]SDW46266.1 DNA polymerase III, chi subunit [Nitrosomonas eutropha]SEI88412.1 DNA polymerase III, chi subunit [Nitrosomonas eutropha]